MNKRFIIVFIFLGFFYLPLSARVRSQPKVKFPHPRKNVRIALVQIRNFPQKYFQPISYYFNSSANSDSPYIVLRDQAEEIKSTYAVISLNACASKLHKPTKIVFSFLQRDALKTFSYPIPLQNYWEIYIQLPNIIHPKEVIAWHCQLITEERVLSELKSYLWAHPEKTQKKPPLFTSVSWLQEFFEKAPNRKRKAQKNNKSRFDATSPSSTLRKERTS